MDEGDAEKLGNFLSPFSCHNQVCTAENVNVLTSWSIENTII